MTNNAIGSMPGTIPEQMTATGMKQPPSFTLVWSSAGPGCAPVPAHHVRRKPRIPKIWLIFALITTLVIVSPTILKFLLDLQPGDHTDNGDGTYWLYGLYLVFVLFTAPPLVALTLCVAIMEGVMWMVDEWRIHGITVRLWLLPLLVVATLMGGVMYWLHSLNLLFI